MMKRNQSIRYQSRGAEAFTLIELLLVLVILGVLAANVVPIFAGRTEQARKTAAQTQISNFETALDAFEVDNSRYPSAQEGLGALLTAPAGLQNWHGPYLKRSSVPVDPWGRPYVYLGDGGRFTLKSYGADGVEGGEGRFADVDGRE